ncbi:2-(1,2-epoxy-1,2-dihydrophenyl)acetyl-CoA isomerase [Pikeienuella piscinae]|uniref:2-(1,2-epoxy-1,2-dihydrophenyl)acetyl-CoA isomerase n=1 Tax=Pikeienuella piscinae TaxID=2748098 RepID=A0A7L5BZ96_9RHOB|nr:enoyl-CoA hydratase-related protein [Pikeienuella piscinae]QIE54919.1 2-(1,2-epoxy-1,2-dihydrophenyl)acetyl-CoA isomerase [Pikeienuella piscinae]
MTYQEILYELAEDVALITLNRPEALNGMTTVMRAELRHALARAAGESRAIVLTGAGRGFCSGQDLGATKRVADIDLERLLREEYEPLLKLIEESPVPILCAVNGPAAGAGANLALACDVVIAARSAYFLEAFARIGLLPDAGGTWRLPRKIGLARAMGMSLFAEPIPAPQAAEWGLIWEVVDDGALTARVGELAARLAAGPTRAYGATRRAIRQSFENSYQEQLALEAREQGALGATRDFEEGVLAFLEKRKPAYEGR